MAQQRPHDDDFAQNIKDMLGFGSESKQDDAAPASITGDGGKQSPAPPHSHKSGNDPSSKESSGGLNYKLNGEKMLRAMWTIASVLSMVVNVILLVVVLLFLQVFPFQQARDAVEMAQDKVANLPPEIGTDTPVDLLGGLYDSFENMENAHIQTTIIVKDEIPVEFTLNLEQKTAVVLSEAVTIPGARVALTTGGLNIFNAPATVTLPAGTSLPIDLALSVPVSEMIPIEIEVPVDIALSETDLQKPFSDLQEVVRPLYCLVKSDATNAAGEAICLKNLAQ